MVTHCVRYHHFSRGAAKPYYLLAMDRSALTSHVLMEMSKS